MDNKIIMKRFGVKGYVYDVRAAGPTDENRVKIRLKNTVRNYLPQLNEDDMHDSHFESRREDGKTVLYLTYLLDDETGEIVVDYPVARGEDV